MKINIFKKMVFLIITTYSIHNEVKAQEFQISDINSIYFTIDRRSQIVYLKEAVHETIWEYDIKTKQTSESKFKSLPLFANKKHLAIHTNRNGTFFYDFEKDSTYQIQDVDVNIIFTYEQDMQSIFSPNDSGFVATAASYGPYYYYSFSRNKIFYPFPKDLRWNSPSWSSDTTMMFLNVNDDAIVDVNLFTGKVDTVFIANNSPPFPIFYFNYKPGDNFITYSYSNEYDNSPKIRRYYFKEKKDSVVYDFNTENPTSYCKGTPFVFTSMKWSPDLKKFSFLGYFGTIQASSVYCYFVDSNKTYLYGECDEYGRKGNMHWLNNDTVIYANYTRQIIYGYDILSPIKTSIEEIELPSSYLSLKSYPNPFNNSVTFVVNIPQEGNTIIRIFNILGEVIKEINLGFIPKGKYNVKWNGKNQYENEVSSGFYIAQLELKDTYSVNQKAFLKILYMK